MTCPQWMRAASQTKHLINKIGLYEREGTGGGEGRRGWILKVSTPACPPALQNLANLGTVPFLPAPDPPAQAKLHQVASETPFLLPRTRLPSPPPRPEHWRKVQLEEEVRRSTGGAPGPGRARNRAGSAGGGPGRAFSRLALAGPELRPGWRRRRPQSRRPAGQRPRAREGASAGREPGERVALSVPGSSWAVHVAPAAAVSAAQPEVGAGPGVGWGEGGCRWWRVCLGRGSVRNGGAARQRVHFPGNQQQAAIFRECCPFNWTG